MKFKFKHSSKFRAFGFIPSFNVINSYSQSSSFTRYANVTNPTCDLEMSENPHTHSLLLPAVWSCTQARVGHLVVRACTKGRLSANADLCADRLCACMQVQTGWVEVAAGGNGARFRAMQRTVNPTARMYYMTNEHVRLALFSRFPQWSSRDSRNAAIKDLTSVTPGSDFI